MVLGYSIKIWRKATAINYGLILLCLHVGIGASLFSQSDSLRYQKIQQEALQAFETQSWDKTIQLAQEGLSLGEKHKDEEQNLRAHHLLAQAFYQKKELSESLKHYLQALNLRNAGIGEVSLSKLYLETALLYENWPVPEKAFESYQQALQKATNQEKEEIESQALLGMAVNKESAGQAEKALFYHQKLRELFRGSNNPKAELESLRNIIRIQKDQGLTAEALRSNQEALGLNEQAADTAEIIISLNNIGVLNRQLENYEEALSFFLRAADMEEAFSRDYGSNPITLSNIGILYQNLGDYPNSLKFLSKATFQTRLATETDTSLLSNISNLIAIIHLNTHDLNKAFFFNQEAIELAKAIQNPALEERCYLTRSQIHEQARDYEVALEFFRKHTQLKDSLDQNRQAQKEENLLRRFSAEQTEKEMSLLLVDKEIEELRLRQEQLENERLRQENSLTEQELRLAQQELAGQEAEKALVLAQNRLLSEQKDRQITLLEKEQSQKELLLTAERLKREQQDRQIVQAEKETAESNLILQETEFQLQNQEEKVFRNGVLGVLFASLIVLGLLIRNTRLRRKANQVLSDQKQELEETLSALKQTQTQLVQSEKMASLGALTAGIAHEINNPLNFVTSNTHALKLDLAELKLLLGEVHKLKQDPGNAQVQAILQKIEELDTEFLNEEVQELVSSIERGAQRTKNIVLGLRTFSRSANDEFVLANIHEGLDSTLTILGSKLKNRIAVHKNYGKLPQIQCQFDKLNQVFMNLLNNAIQAIKDEGEIFIETQLKGEQVELSIRDTGMGISPEVAERIFEPFFTTKPIGKGTGLGLSISYGIIENHKGQITVDSTPGQGTTFRILLPIAQDSSEQNTEH